MSRRHIALLLIGLGVGLLFAVAAIAEVVIWFSHMFIVDIAWRSSSVVLASPFVLIMVGLALLQREKIRS